MTFPARTRGRRRRFLVKAFTECILPGRIDTPFREEAVFMKSLLVFVLIGFGGIQEIEERMSKARREYDMEAAKAVVREAREEIPEDAPPAEQYVAARALLLLTELHRFEFEERYEEMSRKDRRELGKEIDEIAEEGIERAEKMGETSERYRLEADFYALKIRSKYHATKFRKEMTDAADLALEMDPTNPHAYVTVSKPYLFAKPRQGGDVDKAFELLSKALELDPSLEMAKVFLAVAYDKKGDSEKAEEVLKEVVDANPHSKMATTRLDSIRDGLEKAEER